MTTDTLVRATTTPTALAASGRGRRPGATKRQRHIDLQGWLILSPSAVLYLAFVLVPLCAAIVLSLFKWDILSPAKFIGLQNYGDLFKDPTLWAALRNTVIFTISSVVLHMVLGLLLALSVNRLTSRFLRYFSRTTIFFPMLISWASCALVWRYCLDPNTGFINYYLLQLGVHPPNWFQSAAWALPSLIFVDLWRTLGYTFVILLAGLQSVPQYLYESARLDGAGRIRQFWNVTIPMMSPTLLFTSIISIMGAFQISDPMYIITKGGPGTSTISLVQNVYYSAFRDFKMGYASAMALIIAIAIMLFTGIQLWLSKKWVTYDR